eukprot:CAMPEP_0170565574 /NCGR_PEP_ID=MMETSP0211-20121228/79276_1 /TAXON_ID=311385 /ORGANISM="Pseudokeronopsis sp., Strain OXSARD2" /LENGTH=116 /DNA_ID=CAMNT_0010886487 /DNA_START=1757 /DNA_END=2107 /DNA_ORIENTATION=-
MIESILKELEAISGQQTSSNMAANLGNSHMIASCLNLLYSIQTQTKILNNSQTNQEMFKRFLEVINNNLRHQNPQVRKEAEQLFKLLYEEFGLKLDSQLVNQKPQLVQKLLAEAKS